MGTFKMNVLVVVRCTTGFSAKGIFNTTFIVKHFVDQALVEEGFKCAVNRYPVEGGRDLFFNIPVWKGKVMGQKGV